MSYHQDQAPQLPQQSPQQPPTRYPPNQWWSMPQQEIMPSYIPPQLEQQFPQQSQYGQPQSGQQPLPQYEQPYQTRYGWQPVMNYPSPQQFEQIAAQQTKKESLIKGVLITLSATILILIIIIGILTSIIMKSNTNPGSSSSSNISSRNIGSSDSSTSNSMPFSNGTTPAKVGDTISVNAIGCTLVSVNPNPLPGDEITKPKPGYEFIVVNVKLINNSDADIDYYLNDFYARSSSGTTTESLFMPPTSYTSNNLLNVNGKIAPGDSVQGDVILEVSIGDHGAELLWEPYWSSNSANNVWSLGL